MTTQLTPEQAADPETVERVAMAEYAYDRIMAGRSQPPPQWYWLPTGERDAWRFRAERVLAELVAQTTCPGGC